MSKTKECKVFIIDKENLIFDFFIELLINTNLIETEEEAYSIYKNKDKNKILVFEGLKEIGETKFKEIILYCDSFNIEIKLDIEIDYMEI